MTTDLGVLTLAQWLSPAFPVGAFAYSHGLETAIQDGTISNADDLQIWLEDVLEFASGQSDCILLRKAYECETDEDLEALNRTALAFCASAERQMETQLQGEAFCKTTAAIWGENPRALAYPVAVGAAAARLEIDLMLTAEMYLHSFASNLVSGAVRLVPLGQTEGQHVLANLTPLCIKTAKASVGKQLDDLQSSGFASDIAAMKHETLQPRIFRS